MRPIRSRGARKMALEIEAKMKVADLATVRDRLRAAGAEFTGRVSELNTFLDHADESLRKAGKGLRVRINRNADTGKTTIVVTFKGPLQKGAMKTREEREVEVEDHDDMVHVFEALGLD